MIRVILLLFLLQCGRSSLLTKFLNFFNFPFVNPCKEHQNKVECLSGMYSMVYSGVLDISKSLQSGINTASHRTLVSRLTDLYLSDLLSGSQGDYLSSVCLMGDFSAQILATTVILSGNMPINVFISNGSINRYHLSDLEALATLSNDRLKVFDTEDSNLQQSSVVCDVLHIRGSPSARLLSLLTRRLNSSVILHERRNGVSEEERESFTGLKVEWILTSFISAKYELWVGATRPFKPKVCQSDTTLNIGKVWVSAAVSEGRENELLLSSAWGVKDALVGLNRDGNNSMGLQHDHVSVALASSLGGGGVDVSEYVRLWLSGDADNDSEQQQQQMQIVAVSPSEGISIEEAVRGMWLLPRHLILWVDRNSSHAYLSKLCGSHPVDVAASGWSAVPLYSAAVSQPKSKIEAIVEAYVATDGGSNNVAAVSGNSEYIVDVLYLNDNDKEIDEDEVMSLLRIAAASDRKIPLTLHSSSSSRASGGGSMGDSEAREKLIQRSKVVVVRVDSASSVDYTVIHYLVALHKCIVLVDWSGTLELSASLGGAMWVMSGGEPAMEDLYLVCRQLVDQPERRERLQLRSKALHQAIQSNITVLLDTVGTCLAGL